MTPADEAGVELSGATARDRHVAELAVLVVMGLWAGNFIVFKAAVTEFPPVAFTFLRYVLASASLLALLRWREGSIRPPGRDTIALAVLGAIGFGCYQMLWPVALQSIPAGDSALLIATAPVLTALLAVAVGEDALNPVKLIGAAVSLIGVAIVIGAGQGVSLTSSLVGDLLTVAAAACWAIYSVLGATVLRRHSPLVATTWAIVAGTVVMAPVGIGQLVTGDVSGFGLPILLAIGYAGLLAAGLSNVVVFHGLKLLGPTRVTAFQALVPAFAVVLAAIFLGEAIRPFQVVGGAVILAGVALVRRGSWPGSGQIRRVIGGGPTSP